ncbi:hypothetical protein FOZ63_024587 [Perkinsus olseni]|uniref:Uncharacterized protein n=1 Tax=Perkinsus olseni TaxID=32597 RepID=A0A7J6RUD9_PEROL|nr:hypothetical protein FOZ62_001578 [Perkinsus olseni]KAF4723905.1 hypothetical protein FOZ63_024587 [Perkinsus olseni]
MMTSSSVIILLAATSIAVATLVVDDGPATYVYKSKNMEMVLYTATGKADLAAVCKHSVYRTDWLTLHPGDDPVFHRFPDHSSVTLTYSDMIAGFRSTCDGVVKVKDSDVREFARSPSGDMTTQLGGKTITLKRQWEPLASGRFMTNSPSSLIKQQFDIHRDGHAYVRFRCDGDGEDTGYMLYRLTLKKDGNGCYELTRARPGGSVQHLLKKLKEVCPSIWSDDNDYTNQLKNIRFANQDMIKALQDLQDAWPRFFVKLLRCMQYTPAATSCAIFHNCYHSPPDISGSLNKTCLKT